MKRTYSKHSPKVHRLHHKIIYPVDVQEVSVEAEDGTTETHYSFYAVEFEDRGDDISDPTAFARKRYAELRRKAPMPLGYGTVQEQLEMMQEKGFSEWQQHCTGVKDKFPRA